MPWYEKTEYGITWEISIYFQLSGTMTHKFFCGLDVSEGQTQASSWLKWIPVKRIIRRSEVPACQRVCIGRTGEDQENQAITKQQEKASHASDDASVTFWMLCISKSQWKLCAGEKARTQTNITGEIPIPDENDQLSHIRLHSCSLILLPITAYLPLLLRRKLDLWGAKKIGQLEEGEIERGKGWELAPSAFSLSFASHNLG